MSNIAIEFQNVGKMYRLGRVGTGTLTHDLNRWWQMSVLGKEDPYLKIGQTNDRTTKGDSDYVWALRDISFKVDQGEVLGIIGKNGAGKSTLLKLLSNITSPSTGSIKYQGRIASLLEVGTGFHPDLTGRENIYMNGSIMGMSRREITYKLDEIIDFAGVERYIDTPVKRYSSGMTVRLGFAVAAFLEPEILVVDEVLTVGDAEFQKKAIGKMHDVSHEGGRTVLFVSHNMAAVRNLCTRGIVLQNGMEVYDGPAFEAVDYYLSEEFQTLNSRIIQNVMKSNPLINVEIIEINGTESSESTISPNQEAIDIKIKGYLLSEMKMDYIIIFRSLNGQALASFSKAVYLGEAKRYNQGPFTFADQIRLPRFVGCGDCIIELRIYEPRVQNLLIAPQCAKLHFEGSMNEFCRPVTIESEGFMGLEYF